MFTRSFLTTSIALLVAASQVSAHSYVSPGLGVSGVGVRNDVQRPSTAQPCGSAKIADISTSTAAQAVNGLFNAVATNFNNGKDGSTQIVSAKVDTTGTGKSFTGTASVVKNGVLSPTTVGSVPIQIQLPAGTVCTGPGGRCLVSVTTAGGFGDCLVVSTGASTGTGGGNTGKTSTTAKVAAAKPTSKAAIVASSTSVVAAPPASSSPAVNVAAGTNGTTTTTGATNSTGSTNTTTTTTGKKHHHHHHHANGTATSANIEIHKNKVNDKDCADDKKQAKNKKRSREDLRNVHSLVRSVKRNVGAVRSWIWA